MRTGLKLLSAILVLGTGLSTAHARSLDAETTNISALIELTLTQIETKSADCKSAKRSVSNKCGQSYIFPKISNHPDDTVADKINVFIEELGRAETETFTRMESWTETTFNKHNILSLTHTGQIYGAAAIADKTIKSCSNLDLVSGKEISIGDVLSKGYQDQLPRIIFDNLDTELKYKLPAYMRNLLKEKGANWRFAPDQAFQLSDRDFTLCFDHDALSTETVGPLSIPLPYSLIESLIDDQGPLAFLGNSAGGSQKLPQPSNSKLVAAVEKPPVQPEKLKQPAKPLVSELLGTTDNRVGFVEHTCFKDNVTHTITVVEHEPESPFICIVEYDKEYEQKVLWRSRKTKPFCHNSAEKLVAKYEKQWGYTCGRRSTLPGS